MVVLLKLTITLSRPFDKDSKIALNYEGLDPSVNTSLVAEKDTDFSSSQTEIVTIPAGDTTAVVILTAIDDNIQDPNERIVITLNNTFSDTPPSENITYEIGRKAIIKIIDDENPPVAIDDIYSGTISVDEGGELINSVIPRKVYLLMTTTQKVLSLTIKAVRSIS